MRDRPGQLFSKDTPRGDTFNIHHHFSSQQEQCLREYFSINPEPSEQGIAKLVLLTIESPDEVACWFRNERLAETQRAGLWYRQQQVAHGGAVVIEGSRWQACVESYCLVLRKITHSNDKKEQIASRVANIKREVEGRQQELEALAADLGRVEAECESVMERGRWEEAVAVLCSHYLF